MLERALDQQTEKSPDHAEDIMVGTFLLLRCCRVFRNIEAGVIFRISERIGSGMRPGIGTGIVLKTILLISERIGNRLTGTQTARAKGPLTGTAVIAHIHILLDLAGGRIVQNDIASSPAAGLERELRRSRTGARHGLIESASTGRRWRGCRRRRGPDRIGIASCIVLQS